MEIKSLRPSLLKYLQKHNLQRKFNKQSKLFSQNPKHPSLHTERLAPKHLRIYSFRIDRKYRAIFIITPDHKAEIVDINLHYR